MKYGDEYKINSAVSLFTNYEILNKHDNIILLYDKDDGLYRIAKDCKDIFIFKMFKGLSGFKTKSIAQKHYKETIGIA